MKNGSDSSGDNKKKKRCIGDIVDNIGCLWTKEIPGDYLLWKSEIKVFSIVDCPSCGDFSGIPVPCSPAQDDVLGSSSPLTTANVDALLTVQCIPVQFVEMPLGSSPGKGSCYGPWPFVIVGPFVHRLGRNTPFVFVIIAVTVSLLQQQHQQQQKQP